MQLWMGLEKKSRRFNSCKIIAMVIIHNISSDLTCLGPPRCWIIGNLGLGYAIGLLFLFYVPLPPPPPLHSDQGALLHYWTGHPIAPGSLLIPGKCSRVSLYPRIGNSIPCAVVGRPRAAAQVQLEGCVHPVIADLLCVLPGRLGFGLCLYSVISARLQQLVQVQPVLPHCNTELLYVK